MRNTRSFVRLVSAFLTSMLAVARAADAPTLTYEDFESPQRCASCHKEIVQEWKQSMMAQSFTHAWDEQEYFKLALPHALKLEKVAGVKAGCIACHAPLAFLTGDIPPKPAAAGTRANEGVSCDICHSITGSTEDDPFNFSWKIEVDGSKTGSYADAKSPHHKIKVSDFLESPKLCANCHDEQSPYGAWVKGTYREWKAGPYAKEGVRCQDCHMYRAAGFPAAGGKERPDMMHHNFQGSHSPSKLAGAIDVALYADATNAEPSDDIAIRAELFNGKAGHYVPSGSAEERMLWLELTVTDTSGKKHVLPVQRRNFPGEDYTIADRKALAYQDMGDVMDIKGFKGISRDGAVPDGCRIFRRPFFDPEGRMTICQWHTAKNTDIDYRIGPRETKVERYAFSIPENATAGELKIQARLLYAQIPSSLGEFMKLPAEEYAPLLVNEASVSVKIAK